MSTDLVPINIPALTVARPYRQASGVLTAWLSKKAKRTVEEYVRSLGHFGEFIGKRGEVSVAQYLLSLSAGNAHILVAAYQEAMVRAGLSPATVNLRTAALKSLCRAARKADVITWTLEVDPMKVPPANRSGPSRREVMKMIAHCGPDASGLRDECLIRLFFERGLRLGEIQGLAVGDWDPRREAVWVRRKGRTGRQSVTLAKTTAAAVTELVAFRGAAVRDAPLFVSFDPVHGGAKLSRSGIAYIVDRLGHEAGVGHVRPHGLRHAFATEGLR